MPPSGKEIYRTQDELGLIQVFDDGDARYLSFGEDDEQSCVLKAHPFIPQYDYIQAMLLPLLYRRPRDVILLGLGGGALASFLFRHYPQTTLRAVELRQAVIDIAHQFFNVPYDQRLQIFAMEAGDFIRDPALTKTDLILCDLYDGDGMDERYFQPWFIERAAELLNDNGWLVINCWEEHREDFDTLGAITQYFAEVYTCTVDTGNWVVMASRARNHLDPKKLLSQADAQSKKFGFPMRDNLNRLYEVYPGFDDEEFDDENF